MAHSANIISAIKLPNNDTTYQIHDAQAIHSAEELGLSAALRFMGTKSSENAIFTITSAQVGDVWLCTANNLEYVCVTEINGTANSGAWEKFGNVHDAASSKHTHTVTVTGQNDSSVVTGKVTVPTVSSTKKYLEVSAKPATVTPTTDAVLGADTTFTVSGGSAQTTYLKAEATGGTVGPNGTATVLTGLGDPVVDQVLGANATFSVSGGAATTSKMNTTSVTTIQSNTDVTVPQLTSNTAVKVAKLKSGGSVTAGQAPSWSAAVNSDGVLSFEWGAGAHTQVTLPTFDEVDASNTTFGTSVTASKIGSTNVTVATGQLSSTGGGHSVATGIGAISVNVNNPDTVSAVTGYSPTTTSALTGVKVVTQPAITLSKATSSADGRVQVATGIDTITVAPSGNNNVTALTDVSVGAPTVELTEKDTSSTGAVGYISNVSIGTADAALRDGSAAGQVWSQTGGSTGQPQG